MGLSPRGTAHDGFRFAQPILRACEGFCLSNSPQVFAFVPEIETVKWFDSSATLW
jgi:hypothetical protein